MPKIKMDWDEFLEAEAIQTGIVDHTRWDVVYHKVIKVDDRYYAGTYSVGATETQDYGQWDFEDRIELDEVRPELTRVVQYVKVADSQG